MRCPRGFASRTCLVGALSAVFGAAAFGRRPAAATPPASLDDWFRPGPVLQDRNGDGVIDFVTARVVLGEAPTPADIAAAANIAARLGFETSALTVPLGGGASAGPAIVVGAGGLARAGLKPADVGV